MASDTLQTKTKKFDPDLHPENVYDAFEEFVDSFRYEYDVIAKDPPTTLEGAQKIAWIQTDKRKQFLGRYSSRNLQRHYEDEVAEADRAEMTFDTLVERLQARYKPTKNKTIANYGFHQLKQDKHESFDMYIARVKHEAEYCDFKCTSQTCNVKDIMIRDQIVIGTSNEEIRRSALKEEWALGDLVKKGKVLEAAIKGADRITGQVEDYSVNRTKGKPGIYSKRRTQKQNVDDAHFRVNKQHQRKFECYNCLSRKCKGKQACPAYNKECFQCGKTGHFKGAKVCKYRKDNHTRRVKDQLSQEEAETSEETEETASSSSEEDDDPQINSKTRRLKILNVRKIGKLRKSKSHRKSQKSAYQVEIVVNEKRTDAFADTGADINIMSVKTAQELKLPLVKSRVRIKPYGSKSLGCKGYYIGAIMHKDAVANVKIYVIDKDVETLLSGNTCEDLGIIKFYGKSVDKNISRTTVKDEYKMKLLGKYPDVFKGTGTLKNYQVTLHIDENVQPVIAPRRPIPFHLKEKFKQEIGKMESENIIEEHHGPTEWASNVVLAPKADGGIRITIDMREANKAIKDTHIPIARPEEVKAELSGSKHFSKLDFKSAFHQLEMEPKSRNITTFYAGERLMQYRKLTMGTKPASGELTKALRPIFANIPHTHIIHDDVIVATKTADEHHETIEKVLDTIRKVGMTLNPDKCTFNKDKVPFWGMIVSAEGITPDPTKVQALKDASRPRNRNELISFLCMLQSNSEFLPQLSKNTINLRELTKKDSKFHWSTKCEQEFKKVKELFSEDCLLRYFDPTKNTFVYVDAHRTGLAAILKQGKNRADAKPIAFASRATTPVERRYPQLDLEALAIDFALRRFRQYLIGGKDIQVITDHKPLISIFGNKRIGSSRTDRIKLRHQDIDFNVIWEKGIQNPSDYLSRHALGWKKLPKEWIKETEEFEKTIWFLQFSPYTQSISMNKIIQETKKDPILQSLWTDIRRGYIPKSHKKLKQYDKIFKELTVSDEGLLLKGERIILPKSLWQLAIDKAHQGAHPGMVNLKRRLRAHFYFPTLDKMVEEKVGQCESCQLFTPKTTKEPISTQPTAIGPWEEVSVDLFGPMPNKKYILAVQDTFSRFPDAKVVPSTQAKHVISALEETYNNFGYPECHRTDNGPPFNSRAFATFSEDKGISHTKVYPYHPQGNPVETLMKPIGKSMKAAFYNRQNPEEHLAELLSSCRSTPHPGTGVAPGDIIFRNGYRSMFPHTKLSQKEVDEAHEKDIDTKLKRMNDTNQSVRRKECDYYVGQLVWVRNFNKQGKFEPFYENTPAVIYQLEGKKGLLLRRCSDGSNIRRHKDDVKPYKNSSPYNFPDVVISTDNTTLPNPNEDQPAEPNPNEAEPIDPNTTDMPIPEVQRRRSGRKTQPPPKYRDYVMN